MKFYRLLNLNKKIFVSLSAVLTISLLPISVLADFQYYTMPISPNDSLGGTINSWFDHTSPEYSGDSSDTFTRYDGNTWPDSEANILDCDLGTNCYSGHNGLDISTSHVTGKNVLAAADGVIKHLDWQDPDHHDTGYGFYIRIWHGNYNQSTLYGHLGDSPTLVSLNDEVIRGQPIAKSGDTGTAQGSPHLHFSVFDNDSANTVHSIDPYGWSGGGSDPWTIDQGYLWTTNPPSMTVPISSTINSNEVWGRNVTRLIPSSVITLAASASLTIGPGAVVKFLSAASQLSVDGRLDILGTPTSRSFFTSYKDDSVGGDTNANGSANSPMAGDWGNIVFNSGSSASISYGVFKYGATSGSPNPNGNIYLNGGTVSIEDTVVASTAYAGIYMASGSLSVDNTLFQDIPTIGVYAATGPGFLRLSNNNFVDNTQVAYIDNSGSRIFTSSNNTASGSGMNGLRMEGTLGADQTWGQDLPYVIPSGGFFVPSGRKLTIEPGTIVKLGLPGFAAHLDINGELAVYGSASMPVYFTSYKDDSIGGDTNGDGASTTPAPQNWDEIKVGAGASASFDFSVVRYGGSSFNHGANIYVDAGEAKISNSSISKAVTFGIRVNSGSLDVSKTIFKDNSYGIYVSGGTASASQNCFCGNSSYGLYNSAGPLVQVENNYWGSISGPYNLISNPTGTGDDVSDNADYNPWLLSWP